MAKAKLNHTNKCSMANKPKLPKNYCNKSVPMFDIENKKFHPRNLTDNPKRSWLILDEASQGMGQSMAMRFIKTFCPTIVAGKVTPKAIPDIFKEGKVPLVDLDAGFDIDMMLPYIDQALVPDGHVNMNFGKGKTKISDIKPIVFYTTDISNASSGLLARVFILRITRDVDLLDLVNPSRHAVVDHPNRSWTIIDDSCQGMRSSMIARFIKTFCPNVTDRITKVTLKQLRKTFDSGKSPFLDFSAIVNIPIACILDESLTDPPAILYTADTGKPSGQPSSGLISKTLVLRIGWVG